MYINESNVLIALVFIFAIAAILAILLWKGMTAAEEHNRKINQYLAIIPDERSAKVSSIYLNSKKNLGTALLLSLLLGGIGAHHVYLGKKTAALLSLIFCFTGIPLIISLFNAAVMPKTIAEYNLNLIASLYTQFAAPAVNS
jgi:TM2 domain-containing membrane protein YozV